MTDPRPTPTLPAATTGHQLTRLPAIIVAVVIGGGAVVLAQSYQRPQPQPALGLPGMKTGSDWASLEPNAPQWSVIKLETAASGTATWSDPFPARVVFDETRSSRLGSPLAGRVTRVDVERGQHVKAGVPLFTIASPNLAELRSELQRTELQRTAAKINFDRTEALVEGQSLPGKELVTAKQQLAEAELALRLAEQKLAALKVTSVSDASFTVMAPRDGVIVEKNLNIGQQVDASSGTVIAIADLSVVWVVADLFEGDGTSLTAGSRAKILIGDGTSVDGGLDGVVDQVAAVVDPDRHTIPVRVTLANPGGTLRPNEHVQLRFLDATPAKVALPAEAVLSDGTTSYVYVKQGELLKRRAITPGPLHQGQSTVLAGLEPGEQVVTRGAILLDNQIQLDN